MSNLAICGSLTDLAEHQNTHLANVFMDVQHVIIVDCSGSMQAHDARDGEKTRFEAACMELRKLQRQYRGKIAVFGFADDVAFFPGGLPEMNVGTGTDLIAALTYVQDLDGTDVTFDLISDGQPEDPAGSMDLARQFTTKINTIYIGPDDKSAIDFMRRLALASGGKASQGSASGISDMVVGLLT